MKNIFKYSPGFLAGVILSSAFAGAAAANSNLITNTIDELWVFVAGDPVLASQVNENFEYLDLRIDELESVSGGSGMFYPNDLYSYEWSIVFTHEMGGSLTPEITSGPVSFELVNNIFQVSEIVVDSYYLGHQFSPRSNSLNSMFTGDAIESGKSATITSDGSLLYLGWGDGPNSLLILSGAMSSHKDRIDGSYLFHVPNGNNDGESHGTFVALRL